MKSTKSIVVALLLSTTAGIKLGQQQKQLVSVHGPISPVTFDNDGCNDTYDHGHSVSAGPSPCNAGPAELPKVEVTKKVAGATAAATEAGEAKVAAGAAKEAAEAKESLNPTPKAAGAKPKSEAESAAEPPAAPAAAPAKAALI